MAVNPFKAFLFVAGGTTAAAATAYVSGALDPYLMSPPAAIAALQNPAAPQAGQPAVQQPQPTQPVPAPEAAAPTVIAPSFDIVRAEPDGSIVVAGKAAPGATVEIVNGTQAIGSTKAGADGDFAIVLDQPLAPGAHQLVLRATGEDKVVATSPETAVVSIPDNKDGQVLALVEQPGAPSKLITVPEPKQVGSTPPQAAAPAAAPSQPAEGQSVAAADPQAAAKPAETAAGPKVAVDAVEIEGRKVFVAGVADAGRKIRVYANDILLGETVASPGGRFLIEAERDLPAGDYIIRADALESDGVKVAARAAVPFEREPGENQAAVAAQPPAPGEAKPAIMAGSFPTQPSGDVIVPSTGTGNMMLPKLDNEVAAGAPQVLSPKLESAEGAVIIRRGDTLWHISRRVYGLGMRYSTIYLANQEQISDPDRIWPGQVFAVPEKTTEGEAADMSTVKDQTTTVPPKAPL